MKWHELKTYPLPFDMIWRGNKRHEIRQNDRDYVVGDILILRKWNPAKLRYMGRTVVARVTCLTPGGTWGLPKGICVMTLGDVAGFRRLTCPCENVEIENPGPLHIGGCRFSDPEYSE